MDVPGEARRRERVFVIPPAPGPPQPDSPVVWILSSRAVRLSNGGNCQVDAAWGPYDPSVIWPPPPWVFRQVSPNRCPWPLCFLKDFYPEVEALIQFLARSEDVFTCPEFFRRLLDGTTRMRSTGGR